MCGCGHRSPIELARPCSDSSVPLAMSCLACVSASTDKKLEGSVARFYASAYVHHVTAGHQIAPFAATSHATHTHQRMSLTEQRADTVAQQVAERLFGMRAHRVSRAPEKHVTSVAFRHSANAIAPLSPILLLWRSITVMLVFALRNVFGDTLY